MAHVEVTRCCGVVDCHMSGQVLEEVFGCCWMQSLQAQSFWVFISSPSRALFRLGLSVPSTNAAWSMKLAGANKVRMLPKQMAEGGD